MPGYAAFSVLFAALLAVSLWVSEAAAAEIEILETDLDECTHRLTGEIKKGDLSKFHAHFGHPPDYDRTDFDNPYWENVLCLNSPGGALGEALKIAEYLLDNATTVATRVKAGDTCVSSCAVMFLAGKYFFEGESYTMTFDRAIEPGARLGFHAPSLLLSPDKNYPSAAISQSFNIAIGASRQTYELSFRVDDSEDPVAFASPYTMARFLGTPPEDMYYIDTVGDVILSEIPVQNAEVSVRLDAAMVRTICDNAFMRREQGFGFGRGSEWRSSSLVDAKTMMREFDALRFVQGRDAQSDVGIVSDGRGHILGYAGGYPDYYISEAVCLIRLATGAGVGDRDDFTLFSPGAGLEVRITNREDFEEDWQRWQAGEAVSGYGFLNIDAMEMTPLMLLPFETGLEALAPTEGAPGAGGGQSRELPENPLDLISVSSESSTCEELWHARNYLFYLKGYCFTGARGIATFGNEGCSTSSPQMTEEETSFVAYVRQLETYHGCR